MAQLMPLPLTVSCFSEIQIGFTFLVPAHLGSPGKRAVKRVYVCMLNGCNIDHKNKWIFAKIICGLLSAVYDVTILYHQAQMNCQFTMSYISHALWCL